MGTPYKSRISAATSASTTRFVTTTAMKVGSFTVANAAASWVLGTVGFVVTVTHTTVATTDTLGSITVTGTDMNAKAVSEVFTPSADATVTGKMVFRTVTAVAGAGWVQGGATADNIAVGHSGAAYVMGSSGTVSGLLIAVTAAGTITLADGGGTFAVFGASFPVGFYELEFDVTGFMSVALGAGSDVTIFHGPTLPTTYAY